MSLRRSIRRVARVGVGVALKGFAMARVTKAKIIPQSAVIPYRWRGGQVQVLLITSRRSGEWVVPKGLVEPDMTEPASAAKEAQEEAGVVGRVGSDPVGTFEYEKWGGLCVVRVYDMEVQQELSDWPEKADRTRKWVKAVDAAALVKHEGLGDIIAALTGRIAPGKYARPDSD